MDYWSCHTLLTSRICVFVVLSLIRSKHVFQLEMYFPHVGSRRPYLRKDHFVKPCIHFVSGGSWVVHGTKLFYITFSTLSLDEELERFIPFPPRAVNFEAERTFLL